MSSSFPPRIKVCGVRSVTDVAACHEARVDSIGLNFFSGSVRYLEPGASETRKISEYARDLSINTIGLFVNEDWRHVVEVARSLSLTAVQLHGDESVEVSQHLLDEQISVIRAIRLPPGTLSATQIQTQVERRIPPSRTKDPGNAAGLIAMLDTDAGAAFGGSGRCLDWSAVSAWSRETRQDFMLAGGLSPENVAEAIETSGTRRIDVASGVESPKGLKSAQRIRDFADQARKAWS